MNAESKSHQLLTVEEYLKLEETSTVRHEYVGGELYAFAGTSDRHNLIAGNIYTTLRSATRGSDCRPYFGDLKLRASPDIFYYPDVMVICDPEDNDPLIKNRPCLVVEVLSPSTESTDRREKLYAYRQIPSLEAYIIVYQDERRVVRHWRDTEGMWWQYEVIAEGVVPLPCPEIEISLGQIYEDLG